MGHFSNGSEGMSYEERYCGNCANMETCHILNLHAVHNYTKNYVKRMMLNEFIPVNEKGENLKCRMFLSKIELPEKDYHECSLCRERFDTYNELMVHLGDCEE